MDTRTGEIHPIPEAEELRRRQKKHLDKHKREYIEMMIRPTKRQLARRPPRVLPQEKCPCNSGKPFYRCHRIRGNI